MSSFGPRIQSWKEAINEVFRNTLRPLPNIITIENNSTFGATAFQNGEVKMANVQFRIDGRRTKTIPVQMFYPRKPASFLGKRCSYPGCLITKHSWFHFLSHWLTSTPTSTNDKRYICTKHVHKLKKHLQSLCRSNGVEVNCGETVSDYTNFTELCRVLHKAANGSTRLLREITMNNSENARAVRELVINVCNYLVIVDSLIDTHGDLLTTVLPFLMDTTVLALKTATINLPIQDLIELVENIIQKTLFFFGVMYHWQPLGNTENPYSRSGAGIGGMLGVVSTVANGNILLGVACMALFGVVGHVVGNVYYSDIKTKEQMEQTLMNYQAFRQVHQESTQYSGTLVLVVLLSILVAIQAMHITVNCIM